MGWKATATVTAVTGSDVALTAKDAAVTATDDDAGITEVNIVVSYPEGTVPHLTPGAVVTINADC